jgi:hypothetical protein
MRNIYISATPVEGGPMYLGVASHVCTTLWGRVPSGYPKHISSALRNARHEGTFKGYRFKVLHNKPVLCNSL